MLPSLRGPGAGRALSDLASRLGAPPVTADATLTGVTLDSGTVGRGDLYAALPGSRTHGARFAADAASAGAAAVLTDPVGRELAAGLDLPVLVVPDPRGVLGRVSAWIYGEPASRLTTFGITGTNGKTTTTFLLYEVLTECGRRPGLIGTVGVVVGPEFLPSARTTPEAPDVQRLLAVMLERGTTDLAMEVSSHALSYGRVDGIVFDVAGFTNLSQDHLDFHPTMEDYFAAKAELFTPARARLGVICVDDAWGRRLAKQATIPVVTLTTRDDVAADWRASDPLPELYGTTFTLLGPGGRRIETGSPLPGDFNVANTALALVMAASAGYDPDGAVDAGTGLDVPGRMERVVGDDAPGGDSQPGEPVAVVDYAHTPDAVAKALRALRPAATGPLVVVLGAGGDRDRGKRAGMGEAAARHADVVIVTDDNPRSEDPVAIRAAVLAGARGAATGAEVVEVGDRRAAIREGVARAWGGGTLLVAGKGHEPGQEVAGVVHPFDDRQVLAAALVDHGVPAD